MTHLEQYNKIINFRKFNSLPVGHYGEDHHIVPKSICPILKASPENIVKLSAQEHFLAHYHLWLAYRDELHEKRWANKMCYAFHQMKRALVKCNDIESMAKLYEEVKTDFAKLNSLRFKGKQSPWKGKHASDETRKKMSVAKKGFKPWNTGKKLSGFSGKQHSLVTKQKMSESQKGSKSVAYGKHWFTNGNKNIFSKECPVGYFRGRTKNRVSN